MIPKRKQIKKRSWQNIFFPALLGLLIIIVVGFLVVSNYRINKKRAMLNSQISQLKEEIKTMEDKKRQLETQVYQSTQEEYLDKEARETLNLKKPGEEVVTVLPPAEKPKQEEETKQWWNPFSW